MALVGLFDPQGSRAQRKNEKQEEQEEEGGGGNSRVQGEFRVACLGWQKRRFHGRAKHITFKEKILTFRALIQPGAPRGTFEYFLPLWASLFSSALWAVVPALGVHFSLAGAGVFTYVPTRNSIVLVSPAPGGKKLPLQLR